MSRTSQYVIRPLPAVPEKVEDADAAAMLDMVRSARSELIGRQTNYLQIRDEFEAAGRLRNEARERVKDLEAALSMRIEHEELERSGVDPKLLDETRVRQD